jgi:arylsulfatase A-like enzyme
MRLVFHKRLFPATSDFVSRPRPGWPGVALALTLGATLAGWSPAAERRPNVIVILTDDQGSVDANCFGATDLHTPGIDLLAQRGVRFTQFYSGAPVCSPSRAALLTGRYPIRAGVPGNVSSQQGQAGMPPEQVTMAEIFQAAGYATGHIGKWHLGYTPETMPNAQGFDHSFGHMGGCIDNFSHFFYWQGPNRHDLWRNGVEIQCPGQFFPDLMLAEAIEFIERNQERPFFLYFAKNTPHYPYQGDPQWLEHYRDVPYPRNLYAAFVTTLDARVERLVKRVDALGLAEQTIVVYQSDNGHSTEERAHFGGGSAGPYRGAKFSLFEGGIRVPAVISWPNRLPSGAVRGQRAHACDWLPTLAELCGVEPPAELDGRSLTAVIRSESAPSPHDVLHWTTGNSWAVREGDWKLLGNPRDTSTKDSPPPGEPLFLVNLADDPGETKNLAADHPDIVRRLKDRHEAMSRR